MDGECSTYGREETYKHFTRKVEGKRPLGRRKFRWENNIKITLKEIE